MPIENERKFVLETDEELETALARLAGVTRSKLRQAYLDVTGLRIRSIQANGVTRFVFTYKRPIEGQIVEIETDIVAADFDRLWSIGRETLLKVRYSWDEGRYHWDVDFFKTAEERTYFALAEVEMPELEIEPPPVPLFLAGHSLGLVPRDDARFASKRLADQAHAERLLADIRSVGRIE